MRPVVLGAVTALDDDRFPSMWMGMIVPAMVVVSVEMAMVMMMPATFDVDTARPDVNANALSESGRSAQGSRGDNNHR